MSLKIEFAALAAIALGSGGFMMVAEPLNAEAPLERTSEFSQLDYNAFDRDFALGKETCAVGIKRHKLCFTASPLEETLVPGEALLPHVPVLSAEFPILVVTPAKGAHQKLLRYGTTLALINEETNVVEDLLKLSADA